MGENLISIFLHLQIRIMEDTEHQTVERQTETYPMGTVHHDRMDTSYHMNLPLQLIMMSIERHVSFF